MSAVALDRHSPLPVSWSRILPLGLAIAGHVGLALALWPREEICLPASREQVVSVSLIAPPAPPAPVVEKKPKQAEQSAPPEAPATPAPALAARPVPAASPPVAAPAPAAPLPEPPLIEARHDADYLNNPAPAYPPLSRRLGEEGRVVVRAQVGPDGLPQAVDVRTSSGSARLDEAALKAVRQWKFIPARRGEAVVSSWVLIPFSFTLER